jgi:hypothetical protein
MSLADLIDGVDDFRRDRWGRPLIMQIDGTRKPYTRASSATKAIDDTWNLDQWDRRNVAYGLANDASLVARVLAIGGDPTGWGKAEKDAMSKIVEDARTIAKAHKGADIGTAVHRIIQRRNLGETISAGPYQADVDAYYRALDAAGIEVLPEFLEVRFVFDELELAGSADNVVGYSGAHRIADLKTGATVSYGVLGFAGQLAAYANGDLYDVDAECRLPTPEIDRELGFIIHLPAGEGRCDIYEVDLVRGVQAAKVAYQARAAQKAAKSWLVHHTAVLQRASSTSTPAPTAGEIIAHTSPAAPDRAALVSRARALVDAGQGVKLAMAWPEGVPGFKTEHPHTPEELAAIAHAVDAVELEPFTPADATRPTRPLWLASSLQGPAPAPPAVEPAPVTLAAVEPDIEEGPDIDDNEYARLKAAVAALPAEEQFRLERMVAEANRAGFPFSLQTRRTRRRFEIAWALVQCAEKGLDDTTLRACCEAVIGGPAPAAAPLGAILGALTIAEARALAEMADLRPTITNKGT